VELTGAAVRQLPSELIAARLLNELVLSLAAVLADAQSR
jgi:hypothetical protein